MPTQPLGQWLERDRERREITHQLSKQIEQIRARFSYRRRQGITSFSEYISELSDAKILLFDEVTSKPELDVARAIYESILDPDGPYASGKSPSPVTVEEKVEALGALFGLTLHSRRSKQSIRDWNGIQHILRYLNEPHSQLQLACIDTLLGALVDSRQNQAVFIKKQGIEAMVKTLSNSTSPMELRRRCVEFLCLMVEYMDDQATDIGVADYRIPSQGTARSCLDRSR